MDNHGPGASRSGFKSWRAGKEQQHQQQTPISSPAFGSLWTNPVILHGDCVHLSSTLHRKATTCARRRLRPAELINGPVPAGRPLGNPAHIIGVQPCKTPEQNFPSFCLSLWLHARTLKTMACGGGLGPLSLGLQGLSPSSTPVSRTAQAQACSCDLHRAGKQGRGSCKTIRSLLSLS